MGFYGGNYKKRATVGELKLKAEKSLKKLKKKNPDDIRPVIIEGTKIAKCWWGKAWNDNLERYSDYENRIGRGKSYLKNGMVLDLRIKEGEAEAIVQGSRVKPYDVGIYIEPLKKEIWESIVKDCQGRIESLQELIEGKFPKELSELLTAKGRGLFPAPDEIDFHCTCPDWADMCKHVAAVLYGIGTRIDNNPELLFTLRGVNIDELISKTIEKKSEELLKKSTKKSKRAIVDEAVSDIFGIDIDGN